MGRETLLWRSNLMMSCSGFWTSRTNESHRGSLKCSARSKVLATWTRSPLVQANWSLACEWCWLLRTDGSGIGLGDGVGGVGVGGVVAGLKEGAMGFKQELVGLLCGSLGCVWGLWGVGYTSVV